MPMSQSEKIKVLSDALQEVIHKTTQDEIVALCLEALNSLYTTAGRRGREKATGKYETNKELIRWALFFYYESGQSQTQVARTCGVSQTTVNNIISNNQRQQ